jgi:CHASE3 domain sensor protein
VAEEQIIRLLEEIRDLQKQHVENYKDALKNQQQSIEIQRQAVRRQKISLLVIGVVLLLFLFLGYIAWSSHPTR